MAQDIVGSLFGVQQAPDYAAQDYRNAMAMAELNNPKAQGRFLGAMVGAPLGRALGQGVGGLLGVEDPRLQQASVIREAQQQGFDVTTPEGLQQLAQFFVQRGQPGLASQVAQQMQGMTKARLETQTTQENLQRGQQYRNAVAELQKDPNATEQDFINLARQFSTPEAGITAAINAQSKQMLAQEKQDLKDKAALEQQTKAAELAFGRAGIVLDVANQAYNMVNNRTAGIGGAALGIMPGTDASDLAGLIETLKSNLASSELQKIRDASKTGGALGNVSNKDITLLESAVASLNQKQSPEMLRANIKKVIDLYTKIQQDAGIIIGKAPTQTPNIAAPTQAVNTTGWSIVK